MAPKAASTRQWGAGYGMVAVAVAAVCAHALFGSQLMDSIFMERAVEIRQEVGTKPPRAESAAATPAGDVGLGEEFYENEEDDGPDGDDPSCADEAPECPGWAAAGECANNPEFMQAKCPRSCRRCGKKGPAAAASEGEAKTDEEYPDCKDKADACVTWAKAGECQNNPGYMRGNCPVSCNTCKEMAIACDRIEGTTAITQVPGGLSALFERAASSFPQYSPQVLNREPYVLQFDDFVSSDEAAAILAQANGTFVRSLAGDALSPVRTSFQTWCSTPACLEDPSVKAVTARIEALTGVRERNFEYMQVLQYEPGQFYKAHHDQNSAPWTPQGVRLLTFYMYLNDVEEGGATRFVNLGIEVLPKRGRAILWPSVLDHDLNMSEPKTHHEALPPVSGNKYGANVWVHQHDYKTPSERGCEWTTRNSYNK